VTRSLALPLGWTARSMRKLQALEVLRPEPIVQSLQAAHRRHARKNRLKTANPFKRQPAVPLRLPTSGSRRVVALLPRTDHSPF
jgi:hypothetical protein